MTHTTTVPNPRATTTPSSAGHLYVIQFSSNVIKVGRCGDLRRRSEEHRRDAARYDVTIVHEWCSPLVEGVRVRERNLLKALGQLGDRTGGGREYFRDIPFAIAVAQAERADRLPVEKCCCGKCVAPTTMDLTVQVAEDLEPEDVVGVPLRLTCGAVIRAVVHNDDRDEEFQVNDEFEAEFDGVRLWDGLWSVYVNSDIRPGQRWGILR
ncbi:GIY-YIG nuclease family protein [Amycolatopsis sp. NPDC049868]|uniref:GIY-YIG nuclease family protein n=1 Tax=Amycolatopsis sp. NPDC049868 TaxID=3363934 RepID=UPI0037B2A8A0